ncbi:MAG: hypothetical protein DMF93_21975 [Acidobacteria bacterium]|nr:MAG: hypothetical protein DMF93_21975 [Acidobacteriota bacterium]
MLDDMIFARQQERGVAIVGREDEEGRAGRRHRFEAGGRGRCKAHENMPAQPLTADRSARGDVGGDRRDGAAGGGRLGERVSRIGRGCAWTGREFHEARRARADGQRERDERAPAPHFFGSFCFAVLIFLSTSPLSIESPSPFSARV